MRHSRPLFPPRTLAMSSGLAQAPSPVHRALTLPTKERRSGAANPLDRSGLCVLRASNDAVLRDGIRLDHHPHQSLEVHLGLPVESAARETGIAAQVVDL